ncbi:MAG: hypothetical protein JXA18_12270, partial [Chitinispirillaceae bacterium]|nr:hypothetical protein [Chitinispirillaceae bacterium]
MIYVTVGNLTVSLDLPASRREGICKHLSPFISFSAAPSAASFVVEPADAVFSLDGTVKRGMLYYREYTPRIFELLTEKFRLHIDLDGKVSVLHLVPSPADHSSIVYNAIKWFVTFMVIDEGGVPLHASLVADGGDGMLFSGPSGSGKSTIARLLTEEPTPLQRGSDELNCIFRESGELRVAPTPFVSSGLKGRFTVSKDLKRIYFLRHALQRHSIETLEVRRSFYHLLKNSYALAGPGVLVEKLFSSLQAVAASIPCGILSFKNDPSVGAFISQITTARGGGLFWGRAEPATKQDEQYCSH